MCTALTTFGLYFTTSVKILPYRPPAQLIRTKYISLPSSAKQQREMTKFWVVCMEDVKHNWLYLKFTFVSHVQFWENLDKEIQTNWLESITRFLGKGQSHYFSTI